MTADPPVRSLALHVRGGAPAHPDPKGSTMSVQPAQPDQPDQPDPAAAARSREFTTPSAVRLSVEAGAGDIRIDAVGGDRTVVTLRPSRAGDETALELIARTTVEQRGDQVVVEIPRRGVGFMRRVPELVITARVPTGSTLEVASDSADIRTTGRLDSVRTKTGSGDVLLADVGDAHAQTGSGDTQIERADRSVRVQSGSGDVVVRAVEGSCSVGTGSGDVRIDRASGPVQVNSGSGDVSVDDAGDDVSINTASGDHHVGRVRRGQVKINSASGDIRVGVVDGTPVWLDVSSLTGSVHSALEGAEPPTEGEDSVALRVTTVSGDISLSRA